MKKSTVNAITVATLLIAVIGLIYSVFDTKPQQELTRVDCVDITVFATKGSRSAEEQCAPYGGIALGEEKGREALVILVRNQPVGGFEGREHAIR